MHRTFVALFAIIFVVGIQGASRRTPESIDEDAIELAQLAEKFWSLKPAVLKYAKPLVYCQVMEECCGEEDRSNAISFLDPNNNDFEIFENIVEQCMNTTNSNNGNQLCTAVKESIVQPWTLFMNPDINKYRKIMGKHMTDFFKLDEWTTACNAEEFHAFVCLSNTKLVESCAGKMLQKMFNSNYKNYNKTVKNIKKVLTDANQDLETASVEDKSTD